MPRPYSAFRKACRVLKPDPVKMAELHDAMRADANAARDAVRKALDAGADARTLYEAETDKLRRVILVGVLRRGMAALEHS